MGDFPSMHRIPEPELMDDPAQAKAYAEADFSEPHSMFVEEFRRVFPDLRVHGHFLDLGCGPADITVRFARAFPLCVVDGVDGAEAMLRLGRERIHREALGGQDPLDPVQIAGV
jgi:trans-aconitate methyltransferase